MYRFYKTMIVVIVILSVSVSYFDFAVGQDDDDNELTNCTNVREIFIGPNNGARRKRHIYGNGHRAFLIEAFDIYKPKNNNYFRRKKRMTNDEFNDPLFRDQWYLQGSSSNDTLRVKEAWKLGYTGKGIIIAVIDDGINIHHPDIKNNMANLVSRDFLNNDTDPSPEFVDDEHGTKVAGIISSTANNKQCTVGIAYGARLVALRLIGCSSLLNIDSDVVESSAFKYANDQIQIYSNSWGPGDNGRTAEQPHKLARAAFREGVQKGRGGKGSIFVFAAGNGGDHGDCCAFDGYVSSMYTIAVTAATFYNQKPHYTERCSAIMVTSYSSMLKGDEIHSVLTIDPRKLDDNRRPLNSECVKDFGATSAAAPMVSAIIALALEANGQLTWRDVQHLIVQTSNPKPLLGADPRWKKNGAGHFFSDLFGFGLVNAEAMVLTAKIWKTVPAQVVCVLKNNYDDKPRKGTELKDTFKVANTACAIVSLEHVELTVRMKIARGIRGDLLISLLSPLNTTSVMLHRRPKDHFNLTKWAWKMMSVHFWSETPMGDWKVFLTTNQRTQVEVSQFGMIIYGTSQKVDPVSGSTANNNNVNTNEKSKKDGITKKTMSKTTFKTGGQKTTAAGSKLGAKVRKLELGDKRTTKSIKKQPQKPAPISGSKAKTNFG